MENIHKATEQAMPMLINPVTGTTIGVPYNQQNIGQTIRPASTALLTIDSEDRFTSYEQKRISFTGYNSSPYDFTISKNESLMNGFFTRLAVTEVVFPTNAIPNISRTTNVINIEYASGGTTYNSTITLPEGFYTPIALETALQSTIAGTNALLSAFTMVYGVNTGISILPQFRYKTNNPAVTIAFHPLPYNSVAYPYPNTTKQLFDLLAFNNINEAPAVGGGGGATNCEGTRYVDIVCPQLSYNQPLKDTSSQEIVRDALCRIYLVPNSYDNTFEPNTADYTPPGTVPTTIYRNFAQPKQIAWVPNQPIGQLTFQVYDDNGALLVPAGPNFFIDNIEWSMTLQVTEN